MADNRNKMIYGRDVVGKRRPDKSAGGRLEPLFH